MKIKLLRKNSRIPVKANEFDACYDVFASEIEIVEKGFAIVKLGIAIEVPKGYCVEIIPRSSLTKTKWYMPNSIGIIDYGYLDEIQVRLRTSSDDDFPFRLGDRVAQMRLVKLNVIDFVEVDEFKGFNRNGGFGSTGS